MSPDEYMLPDEFSLGYRQRIYITNWDYSTDRDLNHPKIVDGPQVHFGSCVRLPGADLNRTHSSIDGFIRYYISGHDIRRHWSEELTTDELIVGVMRLQALTRWLSTSPVDGSPVPIPFQCPISFIRAKLDTRAFPQSACRKEIEREISKGFEILL